MQAYELNSTASDSLLALDESGPCYQLIDLPIGDNNITAGVYIVFNAELIIPLNDFVQFLTGKDPQSQFFTNYAAFKSGITIKPLPHLPSPPILTSLPAPVPWPVSPTLVATSTKINNRNTSENIKWS